MEIYYASCPRCQKSFHRDANLLGLNIPLHCPHCDLYFEQEPEEGRRSAKGTAFMGLARIDRQIIYLPVQEKKRSP
ncbi:MAG: hypothetical protein KKH04_17050 [Proteobacteria bacterium]|nr:hypothetical protein [Pseudomonadota bacterium]